MTFYKNVRNATNFLFDLEYQQPIQLNFKFSAAVADVICHALVLTRKVISVNSDGNKMVRRNLIALNYFLRVLTKLLA